MPSDRNAVTLTKLVPASMYSPVLWSTRRTLDATRNVTNGTSARVLRTCGSPTTFPEIVT